MQINGNGKFEMEKKKCVHVTIVMKVVMPHGSPETDDRILPTHIALRLMLSRLTRSQPMQNRHPNKRLRLVLDPRQKVGNLYRVPRRRRPVPGLRAGMPRRQRRRARCSRQKPRLGNVDRETRANRRFDVVAAESSRFPEHFWDAQAVVEEQAEFSLVHLAAGVGDQPKQI